MRFLLDEDLPPLAAQIARDLGLDCLSVHEIGRRGLPDRAQLELSAAEGRCFVTRNRDDFLQLTVQFFEERREHHGLLIVPRSVSNREPQSIARALERWRDRWEGNDEDAVFLVDFLPSA